MAIDGETVLLGFDEENIDVKPVLGHMKRFEARGGAKHTRLTVHVQDPKKCQDLMDKILSGKLQNFSSLDFVLSAYEDSRPTDKPIAPEIPNSNFRIPRVRKPNSSDDSITTNSRADHPIPEPNEDIKPNVSLLEPSIPRIHITTSRTSSHSNPEVDPKSSGSKSTSTKSKKSIREHKHRKSASSSSSSKHASSSKDKSRTHRHEEASILVSNESSKHPKTQLSNNKHSDLAKEHEKSRKQTSSSRPQSTVTTARGKTGLKYVRKDYINDWRNGKFNSTIRYGQSYKFCTGSYTRLGQFPWANKVVEVSDHCFCRTSPGAFLVRFENETHYDKLTPVDAYMAGKEPFERYVKNFAIEGGSRFAQFQRAFSAATMILRDKPFFQVLEHIKRTHFDRVARMKAKVASVRNRRH